MKSPNVSIYTQAYNTKPFLSCCIESVLNQSFSDFEYILIDNGSTDGSKELMEQYAQQDSRIRLIRLEENQPGVWLEIARDSGTGQYLTVLDSDDWWEPNYLESLIGFLEKNNLDLAVTGTANYFQEAQRSQVMRQLDEPVVFNRRQFAQQYFKYWTFPSTVWATVMKADLFQKADFSDIITEKLSNGSDTICMLKYMALCARIGIDNTVLYHYRIRQKQVSRQYNPRRFVSNTYVYEEIKGFLTQNSAFDAAKQKWRNVVYLNLLQMTLSLLGESDLPDGEKLEECSRIVLHPYTAAALADHSAEGNQVLNQVWNILFRAEDPVCPHIETIVSALCPKCGRAVTGENLPLFTRELGLAAALRQDDSDHLAAALLDLIAAKRYTKQYDLGEMVCALAQDKPLLTQLKDVGFLRKYRAVYWKIWQGSILEALDDMTGMLLENQVRSSEEAFLQLYLSAAAYLEQVPAFLFGKTQLAGLYQRRNQLEQYQAIVDELKEMGVEEW